MGAIISSVVTALILAAIFAAMKSHWLYVVAPKLYLNTPISNGQIVTLTIYNGGFLAEEDVTISLRPSCKFELIATSKSSLTSKGQIITIPKLSRHENVTVLLLIEDKAFDTSDIESVESKASKGKVVESKDKALGLLQRVIAFPIVCAVMSFPFAFGTYWGAENHQSIVAYLSDALDFGSSKQLAGFKSSINEEYGRGNLVGALSDHRLQIETTEVLRHGDILTVSFVITNHTAVSLFANGNIESSGGDIGPLDYKDTQTGKFGIAVGEQKSVKLKTFLPESLSVKIVTNSFHFDSVSDGEITIQQVFEFK